VGAKPGELLDGNSIGLTTNLPQRHKFRLSRQAAQLSFKSQKGLPTYSNGVYSHCTHRQLFTSYSHFDLKLES
jgi:hypothetical protein